MLPSACPEQIVLGELQDHKSSDFVIWFTMINSGTWVLRNYQEVYVIAIVLFLLLIAMCTMLYVATFQTPVDNSKIVILHSLIMDNYYLRCDKWHTWSSPVIQCGNLFFSALHGTSHMYLSFSILLAKSLAARRPTSSVRPSLSV